MWRQVIVDAVRQHPGIGFTDLQEVTGAANGVLQYHIHHAPQIERVKDGIVPAGYCDSCELREHCQQDCIRKMLRDPLKQEIVRRLDDGETQAEIADALGKHRSTVHHHVQRLKAAGVIDGDASTDAVRAMTW